MRYAKATDDFYVPEAEDVRSQVGKPGAYSFEPVSDEARRGDPAGDRGRLQGGPTPPTPAWSKRAFARELARVVIPVGGLHTVLLDGQTPGP